MPAGNTEEFIPYENLRASLSADSSTCRAERKSKPAIRMRIISLTSRAHRLPPNVTFRFHSKLQLGGNAVQRVVSRALVPRYSAYS